MKTELLFLLVIIRPHHMQPVVTHTAWSVCWSQAWSPDGWTDQIAFWGGDPKNHLLCAGLDPPRPSWKGYFWEQYLGIPRLLPVVDILNFMGSSDAASGYQFTVAACCWGWLGSLVVSLLEWWERWTCDSMVVSWFLVTAQQPYSQVPHVAKQHKLVPM